MHHRNLFSFRVLTCLACLLVGGVAANGTVRRQISPVRLIRVADLIVSGAVTRIRFQWDE
jgi:hypothetical protein